MNNLETLLDLPCFENLSQVDSVLLSAPLTKTTLGILNGGNSQVDYHHIILKDAVEVVNSWVSHNFPISIQVSDRVKNTLVASILLLIKSKNEGEIENPRFKDIKSFLNGVLSEVSRHLSMANVAIYDSVNTRSENHQHRCEDLEVISVWLSDARELRATHKKLIKSKNPLASVSISYIEELLQVADLIDEFKGIVIPAKKATSIKSALAATKPQPHNQKTCAYCLRSIRLKNDKNDTIAYHGFKRSDWSIIDASCKGAEYKPFEVSPEGTLQHLKDLVTNVVAVKEAIEIKSEQLKSATDKKIIAQLEAEIRYYTYYIEKDVPFTRQLLKSALKKSYPDLVV